MRSLDVIEALAVVAVSIWPVGLTSRLISGIAIRPSFDFFVGGVVVLTLATILRGNSWRLLHQLVPLLTSVYSCLVLATSIGALATIGFQGKFLAAAAISASGFALSMGWMYRTSDQAPS